MKEQTIAFIGLGLIGGSIARGLKRFNPDITIMAYMRTRTKLEQAKKEGIIDVILDGIGEPLKACDVIFLCTPVEYNAQYLAAIKPFLKEGAFITDVGSTKTSIHREAARLGLSDRFIGGHPMAGSEKTGYEHSTDHLLENAFYLITPALKPWKTSSPEGKKPWENGDEPRTKELIRRLTDMAKAIGAIPLILDFEEHDKVVAAISHLPHIVASSLVNLVRDSDNRDGIMKQVAAGGFKDITRIASSSPEMWEQICMANREPIIQVLSQYIRSLSQILSQIQDSSQTELLELFASSREYRDSITDRAKGALTPEYSFSVDIVDEAGAISTLSVILAAKGINIKNIGINNNREQGEGALRITFYERDAMENAKKQLEKYHYEILG
ncbi:MAG: prephenate dehydrogenase [Lachnospiraceae bacterium]|nr:prephenate dehydrogenase [Lachnospiraceae bacterium]